MKLSKSIESNVSISFVIESGHEWAYYSTG